jgi:hypothetical protein
VTRDVGGAAAASVLIHVDNSGGKARNKAVKSSVHTGTIRRVTLQQCEQATLEGLPWSQCDAQEVFETTHSQITWDEEQLQGEESHDGLARFSDQGECLVSKVAMNTDSCDTIVWDEEICDNSIWHEGLLQQLASSSKSTD